MSTVPKPVRHIERPAIPAQPLTVVTNDWTLIIPPEAHTMEGFRKWATADDCPEDVRVTFLQGEIILDMSNEETQTHNKVKMEIARVLMNILRETDEGEFYGD